MYPSSYSYLVFLSSFFSVFVFQDRVSLCNSSGHPGNRSVGQAVLKLTALPSPILPFIHGLNRYCHPEQRLSHLRNEKYIAMRLREAVARVRAVRKRCLKGTLGREAGLLSLKKHHSNCKDSKRKTWCSNSPLQISGQVWLRVEAEGAAEKRV